MLIHRALRTIPVLGALVGSVFVLAGLAVAFGRLEQRVGVDAAWLSADELRISLPMDRPVAVGANVWLERPGRAPWLSQVDEISESNGSRFGIVRNVPVGADESSLSVTLVVRDRTVIEALRNFLW